MSVVFKIDFSHIKADGLKPFRHQDLFNTKPWSDLDLGILDGLDLDIDLHSRAVAKFDELAQGLPNGLDVLDVVALINANNDKWQDDKLAAKVCHHWWSYLIATENKQRELYATLIVVLYAHNNPEFSNITLNHLKKSLPDYFGKSWSDMQLKYLVKYAIENNAKEMAKVILEVHRCSIRNVFKRYPLPLKSAFKDKVRIH